ncbi:MAG: transglycosylase SLT domain-containing protein [Alistipes sp.]|nr:transglycosylase SLT domain-containing protein [Alistipes sp.]
MRKKSIAKVVAPALFVSVGIASALYSTNAVVEHQVAERRAAELERMAKFSISQYDALFKDMGEKYKLDWRLLAAIARAESVFRFDAISPAGAIGLMQIMPFVAQNMGYERSELFDPRTNVEIAAQLLLENKSMLNLSQEVSEEEQLRFLLACYNAGYTRIADARRLAKHYDADANKWQSVRLFLSWLNDPEFANHEVVQSGTFNGSKETLEYVDKVMHLYNLYKAQNETIANIE